MHVIVVGGGRMGRTLSELLINEGHDVVIVEKDPQKCEKLARELNATVINGDAAEMKTLEEAGIEKADIVAAVTSKEEINIMVCLLAKSIRHCKTVARISRPQYKEIFHRLGIDIVISPESAAATYLEEIITKPEVVDLAFIERGDAVILEFEVNEKSRALGKKVKDLEYPKGSLIIAIYENNRLKIPDPNVELKNGDKVLVLAKNEVIDKVRKMFR